MAIIVVQKVLSIMNKPLVVCALKNEFSSKSTLFNILYTGVGKVNAAISLTDYILNINKPTFIINYGTAGSQKENVGSLIDCTKFIQRDMDASGLGFEIYETPLEPLIPKIIDFSYFKENPLKTYSMCATGDNFLENKEGTHVGDVVDMEAYALAKVCCKFKIPFISYKYISDGADENAAENWTNNVKKGNELFKSKILSFYNLNEN